jgi:thiamine biosynthesis lipoprotein
MTLSRRAFLASAAAFAAAAPAARAGALRVTGGPAFGSYWRLALAPGADAPAARAAVARVVAGIDAAMSPYRGSSDLGRFNRRVTTDLVPVTPQTAALIRQALALWHETQGAFDPTLGPLTARWGFGPITGGPGGPELLSVEGDALRKARADLTLDLCGIAKGHALDRAVAALDAAGAGDYLLEMGGEVFARGRHPEGRPWQVGVEGGGGALVAVAALEGIVAATSGDAAQGYVVGGRRYGHIIDPATGRPAPPTLASVTVFDPSGARADALATALCAMGRDRAEAFAAAAGIDALLIAREVRGPRLIATGAAAARLLPGSAP